MVDIGDSIIMKMETAFIGKEENFDNRVFLEQCSPPIKTLSEICEKRLRHAAHRESKYIASTPTLTIADFMMLAVYKNTIW